MTPRRIASAALLCALLAASPMLAKSTSCTVCHGDAELFEAEQLEIVRLFESDVHAGVGLSCHDCHGGNPDPALADDLDAMDEEYEANPYGGVPARAAGPGFCGRCHSSAEYMKRFNPAARVDQEQEYWTSHHGQALAAGDSNVAICTDCHGAHGIRGAEDGESGVHPTRVAKTCNECHGNAELMQTYSLPDGRPVPVDQYARWRKSVHAEALVQKEDLTAPTCNDCHGNHGATPPGLDAVTFVCGQCHGREAGLFRGSPKHQGFEEHNELLADAGEDGCAACHDSPQSEVANVRSFGECTACHGNHGIVRPTVAMFAALPSTPCAFCHEGPSELLLSEETEKTRKSYQQTKAALLEEAQSAGLADEELFNHLVDAAWTLSSHTLRAEEDQPPQPRPEFRRLFEKFRIGKTYYTYVDPLSGEQARADIVRCGTCHGPGSVTDSERPGATTGTELVTRMSELTARTAAAERLLLAARRGGVETRDALLDIDHAIDSQIGLEVLVHGFSSEQGSAFAERYAEGLAHAEAARGKAQRALEELEYRRRGLAWALIVIVLALVALGLKIRQLSRETTE